MVSISDSRICRSLGTEPSPSGNTLVLSSFVPLACPNEREAAPNSAVQQLRNGLQFSAPELGVLASSIFNRLIRFGARSDLKRVRSPDRRRSRPLAATSPGRARASRWVPSARHVASGKREVVFAKRTLAPVQTMFPWSASQSVPTACTHGIHTRSNRAGRRSRHREGPLPARTPPDPRARDAATRASRGPTCDHSRTEPPSRADAAFDPLIGVVHANGRSDRSRSTNST